MNFFQTLSVYSVLLPLGLGLIIYRYLGTNSRIVIMLLAFATASQFASLIKSEGIKWAFYNLYTVIDSLVWTFLFFRNSQKKEIRFFILIISSIVTIWTFAIYIAQGIDARFYHELVCLNSVVQVIWVLAFFYERYLSEEVQRLITEPMFWYSLGLLIYAPCTYFLFAFYHEVHANPAYTNLWLLHNVINSFMYFIFAVGVFVNLKRASIS